LVSKKNTFPVHIPK